MAEELKYIKSEIEKGLARFKALQRRVYHLEEKMKIREASKEERLKRLEERIKKLYPNARIDQELLELVGIHPYNPLSKDKEVIREAVAEKHGR